MTTTQTLATLVTVGVLAATPAVAGAAAPGTDRCADGGCRIAVNHNEVLVVSGA